MVILLDILFSDVNICLFYLVIVYIYNECYFVLGIVFGVGFYNSELDG